MSVINFSKFACLIFMVLVMLLTGCGSSGGNEIYGPVVTPPSINLIGKYNLTTFRVEFSDGNTWTPSDLKVSGKMIIDSSTLTQDLTINDFPWLSVSNQYDVTFTDADHTQGVFTFINNNSTHTVSFTISGMDLTTYSGVYEVSPDPYVTAKEWDTWRKISDVPQAPPLADRSESEDGYWWIFKSLRP